MTFFSKSFEFLANLLRAFPNGRAGLEKKKENQKILKLIVSLAMKPHSYRPLSCCASGKQK